MQQENEQIINDMQNTIISRFDVNEASSSIK